MRYQISSLLTAFFLLSSGSLADAKPELENLRRLYDFSPVSATNPVLVRVRKCEIEIPVSEFLASLGDYNQTNAGKTLTLEQKRRTLDGLLDDHLLLWEGYSEKADQSEEITQELKGTESILLRDLLLEREVGSKAKSGQEYKKLLEDFCRRIFDKTDVTVWTNEYQMVKVAAKRVNKADEAALKAQGTNQARAVSMPSDGLSDQQRNLPLASCKAGTIHVGDLLAYYRQRPPSTRPDLEQPDNLIGILREMFNDQLLVLEARERNLDKSAELREQMQRNRNILVRMRVLEELTQKANQAMQAPDTQPALKEWYKSHLKSLYTIKDEHGKEKIVDFTRDHELIQNDYFEDLQEQMRLAEIRRLRQIGKIEIDEKLLEKLVAALPARPPAPPDIPPP